MSNYMLIFAPPIQGTLSTTCPIIDNDNASFFLNVKISTSGGSEELACCDIEIEMKLVSNKNLHKDEQTNTKESFSAKKIVYKKSYLLSKQHKSFQQHLKVCDKTTLSEFLKTIKNNKEHVIAKSLRCLVMEEGAGKENETFKTELIDYLTSIIKNEIQILAISGKIKNKQKFKTYAESFFQKIRKQIF